MRRFSTAAALCVYATGLVGCVSQAEFDQLMFENRSLAAEKESYAQRSLDAEAQSENFRKQIQLRESELDMQRSMSQNLQDENDRLDDAVRAAQAIMARVNIDPDPPLVISNPLPPALDAALRSFAAAHPESVEYDSQRGIVRWKSDLVFASGKDVVREDAKSTLRSFASIVSTPEARDFEIMIVGHTDNEPIKHAARFGHHTNWHLSSHRAIAVASELIDAQVNPERLGILGYGEFKPAASNDSTEGRTRNRRVEIMIIGKPKAAAVREQTLPASGIREK